jgi:hypothetical protein
MDSWKRHHDRPAILRITQQLNFFGIMTIEGWGTLCGSLMSNAFLLSTIDRHEQRLKRLQRSIDAVDTGLQIAKEVDHRQAFYSTIAMIIGMPTATVGVVLCGFLFNGWEGQGLWYGVMCLFISAVTIRPSLHRIDTQREALQERLIDLVLQRQKVHDTLREVLEKLESPQSKTPIDVREEAA